MVSDIESRSRCSPAPRFNPTNTASPARLGWCSQVALASCLGQPQLRGERRFERRRKIKDELLARGTVEQVDDFSGRVKAKRVEFAPAPRLLNDPRKVKNASDFAGVFEIPSSSKKLYVLADGPALNIVVGDNKIALESLGEDSFLADEYSWRRFPLVFGRNRKKGGGARARTRLVCERELCRAKRVRCAPAIRIVRRALSVRQHVVTIHPHRGQKLGQARFRVGGDSFSPDVAEFLQVASGKALLLKINGSDRWRVETP